MILYQPTVEVFKFSIWKWRWVHKTVYPSTIVFADRRKAIEYEDSFVQGLRRRGYKLTSKNHHSYIAELGIETEQVKENL